MERAVHLLMSQPGFWAAIEACFLPSTASRTQAGHDPSAADASVAEGELWQLRTEAAALQLLVVQVHACSLPGDLLLLQLW